MGEDARNEAIRHAIREIMGGHKQTATEAA
jgi:hypothetical protein